MNRRPTSNNPPGSCVLYQFGNAVLMVGSLRGPYDQVGWLKDVPTQDGRYAVALFRRTPEQQQAGDIGVPILPSQFGLAGWDHHWPDFEHPAGLTRSELAALYQELCNAASRAPQDLCNPTFIRHHLEAARTARRRASGRAAEKIRAAAAGAEAHFAYLLWHLADPAVQANSEKPPSPLEGGPA